MKFGWILTENQFLPNSARNLVGIVGMRGGVSSTQFVQLSLCVDFI